MHVFASQDVQNPSLPLFKQRREKPHAQRRLDFSLMLPGLRALAHETRMGGGTREELIRYRQNLREHVLQFPRGPKKLLPHRAWVQTLQHDAQLSLNLFVEVWHRRLSRTEHPSVAGLCNMNMLSSATQT